MSQKNDYRIQILKYKMFLETLYNLEQSSSHYRFFKTIYNLEQSSSHYRFFKTIYNLFPVYLLAYLFLDRKAWDSFTRAVSLCNALQCIYMVIRTATNTSDLFNFEYQPNPYSTNSLFIFSAYLCVDGIFQLPDLLNFSFGSILSIIHHMVGGFGIYLIANERLGFFLGFYFAMTEISTPFLNLSWFYRTDLTFGIFYFLFIFSRIASIPLLLYYLNQNAIHIYQLSSLKSFMCFYASYALIALNCIWSVFLTTKFLKICRRTCESKKNL